MMYRKCTHCHYTNYRDAAAALQLQPPRKIHKPHPSSLPACHNGTTACHRQLYFVEIFRKIHAEQNSKLKKNPFNKLHKKNRKE